MIYLIAIGFQLFVLLFIFAKRQIMRFAWSSRKEPHSAIGTAAPAAIKRKILSQIQIVSDLKIEPRLSSNFSSGENFSYWYRMRTIDDAKLIELELDHFHCSLKRLPNETLNEFLLRIHRQALNADLSLETINLFHQFYERAKFLKGDYNESDYCRYSNVLNEITNSIRRNRDILPNLQQEILDCSSAFAVANPNQSQANPNSSQADQPLLTNGKENDLLLLQPLGHDKNIAFQRVFRRKNTNESWI